MHRRRLQFVAGTTFSVSLPKEWVLRNNLKPQDEVLLYESADGDLLISSKEQRNTPRGEITLDVERYATNIDQVIFALYYAGIETVTLKSKAAIPKETKAKIRRALSKMSGKEITYEDRQRITVRIIMDHSRIQVPQLLYRMGLLIDLSIATLLDEGNIEEERVNEEEIDRVHHLVNKLVYLAMSDASILASSKIGKTIFLPPLFLMSKRLEHLGDRVFQLAGYLTTMKSVLGSERAVLEFTRKDLARVMKHLNAGYPDVFQRTSEEELVSLRKILNGVRDKTVFGFLRDILRHTLDIEGEIITLSFYHAILREPLSEELHL